MPDVPTAADSGVLPSYEAYSWVGLLAPAGTPAPVVAHLNAECCASLANPTVRAAMEPRAWPDTAGWLRLRLFGDRISMLMPPD